jgi:hypothetical protein
LQMKVLFYLIFLFIGFSFATEKAPTSKWTPEIGISIGSPAPLFLSVGLHYQFLNKVGAFIRTEGLGSHTRKNDYWCGARGAIGFSLFRDQPFFLESLEALSNMQFEILQGASKALKKNGLLVYATCSQERVETTGVLKRFLAANPDFALEGKSICTGGIKGMDHFFAQALVRQ